MKGPGQEMNRRKGIHAGKRVPSQQRVAAAAGRTSTRAFSRQAATLMRPRTAWCRSPSRTTTASPCSTCRGGGPCLAVPTSCCMSCCYYAGPACIPGGHSGHPGLLSVTLGSAQNGPAPVPQTLFSVSGQPWAAGGHWWQGARGCLGSWEMIDGRRSSGKQGLCRSC